MKKAALPKIVFIERRRDDKDRLGNFITRYRGTDAATKKAVRSKLYRGASVPGSARRKNAA